MVDEKAIKQGSLGMTLRVTAAVFETADPERAARFWADILGRTTVSGAGRVSVPGDPAQLGLAFVDGAAARTGGNPVHLHVVGDDLSQQQELVAVALDIGARHVDVGQRPDEDHVVLADPAGYEFCVLLRNSYLAGTGLLGEIACAGSRSVGHFFSEALGWPLVWDRDDETVIQLPGGGTKLAWSGTARRPGSGTGQWLELSADTPEDVDALLAPGQGRPDCADGRAVLTDPDGTRFVVTIG